MTSLVLGSVLAFFPAARFTTSVCRLLQVTAPSPSLRRAHTLIVARQIQVRTLLNYQASSLSLFFALLPILFRGNFPATYSRRSFPKLRSSPGRSTKLNPRE